MLKNGKLLLANLDLKREGDYYQTIQFPAFFSFLFAASQQGEWPEGRAGKTPGKPSIELTDEQKTEVSSYLNEILNSTSTIEAQAKAKGQEWKNYGRHFYQEQTGASDMDMQVLILKSNTSKYDRNADVVGATQAKTWMDFAAWSLVPWTSQEEEPLPVMAAKARFLGTQFLQRQWEEQVGLCDISMFCPSYTSTLHSGPGNPSDGSRSDWACCHAA